MADELRFDAGRLGKVKRTPQGGARIPAALTRTGILEYRRADGSIRREYRPAEEVFRQDSLDQLLGSPVTVGHVAMVDSSNWKNLAKGHIIGNIRKDGERVAADIDIQDAETLQLIDSTAPDALTEVSMGYRVDYDPTPGEFEGVRYDGVQRNIRYNHVALLPAGGGRAGRDIGLRLDSNSAVCDTDNVLTSEDNTVTEKVKVLVRLDGKDYEKGSDEHLAAIEAGHKGALDKESARADAAEEENKKLKTKLAEANDPKRLDTLVAASVELRTKAARIFGGDYRFDGKSDREIMVDAIKVDRPEFTGNDPAGEPRSDEYVRATFDGLVARDVRADSIHALPVVLQTVKPTSSGERTSAQAKAEMDERNRNAWQKK